jgi:ATP-dependent helicase/nuclease subunit B
MSLQFIFGNSRSDKSTYIFEEIISLSLDNPKGDYLVIVPEQFTMETQKKLCNLHPNQGIMNIDVLSFARLAHRVFDEVGGNRKILLDDTGKNLILRKIVGKYKDELEFLKGNILKSGYISEVKSILSEFTQYGIGIDDLDEFIETLPVASPLYFKLKDIKRIAMDFGEFTKAKYITGEEVLDILKDKVKDSRKLEDSVILLEGFTGFTPVQNRLIGELLKVCSKVIVSVTIDDPEDPFVYRTPFQLFGLPKKMVTSLVNVAKEEKIKIDNPINKTCISGGFNPTTDVWLQSSRGLGALIPPPIEVGVLEHVSHRIKIASVSQSEMVSGYNKLEDKVASESIEAGEDKEIKDNRELDFLEKNLFRSSKLKYQEPVESIFLNIARNPNTEAELVAGKIKELVRVKGWRYRDVAVIVGDMNTYGPSFIRAFEKYNIKYFMDYKKSIMINSFVDYLRTILDMVNSGFNYNSVFRLLRTGLFTFNREEVDLLDNYIRATGISGFNSWKSPWQNLTMEVSGEELEQLNTLRVRFVETLEPLVYVLTRKSKKVVDITLALYDFLVNERIQEQLKLLEEELQDKGELALAKEYAQIYGIVMDLFDEFVEFLGEEKVSLLEYQQILEAGLEEAKVGVIPPTLDQVIVGDLERTRIGEVKVVFLVGAGDSAIPGNVKGGGLLSEEERQRFEAMNLSLSPDGKEQVFIQKYYLYLILTKAKEQLYISYSKSTTEGKSLRSSYLINEIRKLFPKIKVQDTEYLPLDKQEMSTKVALGFLAEGLANRGYTFSDSWKELYSSYLNARDVDQKKLEGVIDSSFFRNKREKISEASIKELYGDLNQVSVSRMERFVTCPYQHFLTYGLKVREIQEYGFESVDFGVIAHEAMEEFSKRAKEVTDSWEKIDEESKVKMVEESVNEAVKDYGNQILHSSKRYEYMIGRIKKLVSRTIWALTTQMAKSDFAPYDFEMKFASGKIDRVDVCENEEKIYVKVMDYKTGSKSFDITAFYHGLQLQLPVYLNAATQILQNQNPRKEVLPAGFVYYQMQDPFVEKKTDDLAVNKEMLKKLQPDGMISREEEILEHLENNYTKGSPLIPGATMQITRQEFETLLNYTDYKVDRLKEKMALGEVEVKPYQLGSAAGCDYCKYGNICRFDPTIEGFDYNQFSKIDKELGFVLMEDALNLYGEQIINENIKNDNRVEVKLVRGEEHVN